MPHLGLTIKGMLPCTALIEHDSQGPDIAFLVVGPVFAELRRQVVGSANDCFGKAGVGAHVASHAQIANLDLLALQEDVLTAHCPNNQHTGLRCRVIQGHQLSFSCPVLSVQ